MSVLSRFLNFSLKLKAVIILSIVLAGISIYLRIPTETDMFRDVDASYHVLQTLLTFDQTPISVHHLLPITSFGSLDDKGIPWGDILYDDSENFYYGSFSPALFIAPYLFIKLFNLPVTFNSLFIFNSILYVISLVFTVLVFLRLFKDKLSQEFVILATTLIYAFQPEIMQSQGSVYWAHSLYQMLFIVQVYAFMQLAQSKRRWHYLFFVIACLIPYVEWTGFLSNVGFAFAFIFSQENPSVYLKRFQTFLLTVILTVSGGLLIIVHFISVLPYETFMTVLSNRFSRRSYQSQSRYTWIRLLKEYNLSFHYLLICLLVLIALVIAIVILNKRTRQYFISTFKSFVTYWLVLTIPALENVMLHAHATDYTFDRMKLIFPLMLVGFICFVTIKYYFKRRGTRFAQFASVSLLLGLLVTSILNLDGYTQHKWGYVETFSHTEMNAAAVDFINTNFPKQNSVLSQRYLARGYSGYLFQRNIYSKKTLEQLTKIAEERGKRYAVSLLEKKDPSGYFFVYSFEKFRVYDLKLQKEMVYVYDGKQQTFVEVPN